MVKNTREDLGIHLKCVNCKPDCKMTVTSWMWEGWMHDIRQYGETKCYCGCEHPRPLEEIAKLHEQRRKQALEDWKNLPQKIAEIMQKQGMNNP